MTRADVVAGAVLATVFAAMAWQATTMTYGTEFAPGPGFTPLWLGVIGAILALTVAVRARGATDLPPAEPRAEMRVALSALGIAVVVMAAPIIGLVLAIAAYLIFFTLVIERLRIRVGLASSAGTAVFVYLVFERFLNVPFPIGPLGF